MAKEKFPKTYGHPKADSRKCRHMILDKAHHIRYAN